MSIGRAVEHFVVHDDRYEVLRELDICLNAVSSCLGSLVESKHCVFRILPAETAVRKNIHMRFLSAL